MTVQLLIGIIGIGVTALVGAGMIYLTPRYTIEVGPEGQDPQGSDPGAAEERPAESART